MRTFLLCLFSLSTILPGIGAQTVAATPPILLAHAHNDYEHPRPLTDALDQQFHSVEADIWLAGEKLLVSHNGGNWKGSLQELYLDPLQARVKELGSVHGDGQPFLLWIDLKSNDPPLLPLLHELLGHYPMLTVYDGTETKPGSVTVILTGNARLKEAYVTTYHPCYACRDGNTFSPADPPADHRWLWYGLRWQSYVAWDGKGPMSPQTETRLRELVANIHAQGRRVRFYATPETELYWRKAQEIGIDLINTDRLRELHDFLAKP